MIEIMIIAVISLFSYYLFSRFDILEKIVAFSAKYESYEVDEIVSTIIVLVFCLAWFSIRRWHETARANDIISRKNIEIQSAYDEIKQLRGILPICSFCKKIRDDSGYWEQVDIYIQKHSDADVSHSICPKCLEKNYPEEFLEMYDEKIKQAE